MSDLTVADAANQMKCSISTVYGLVKSGDLEHYRLSDGGRIRITPEALDEYRRKGEARDPWRRTRPLSTRKAATS